MNPAVIERQAMLGRPRLNKCYASIRTELYFSDRRHSNRRLRRTARLERFADREASLFADTVARDSHAAHNVTDCP